ncbi:4862_t:CDS:1, partial [Gigaspora margarita]
MPVSETLFLQEIEEPEPEETIDVFFEDWVSAIHKVWDKNDQKDRNQMTAADLEAIV